MMTGLHNALSGLNLEYHTLGDIQDGVILLTAISLDPKGISEVILINEMATQFNLVTKWDGHNIRIAKQSL